MRLRPLLSGVAVVAALAAVMLLGSIDSTHAAATFNPTVSVCIGTLDANNNNVCSTATTPAAPGVPSDITAALCIGGTVPEPACTAPKGTASTDVNFNVDEYD